MVNKSEINAMKTIVRRSSQKLLRNKGNIPKIFLAAAVVIATMVFCYKPLTKLQCKNQSIRVDQINERKESINNRDRTDAVIIFTEMRSGSSFIGEFFNQHPEVSYFFEPLHSFGRSSCDFMKRERIEILENLVSCKFSNLSSIHRRVLNYTGALDTNAKCRLHGICFLSRSGFIRRNPDLCRDPSRCDRILSDGELSVTCRRSLMPVIKIIRICRISDLREILQTSKLNIKIIHVVRDPRATIASRKQLARIKEFPGEFNISEEIVDLCERHMRTVDDLRSAIRSHDSTLYRITSRIDEKNINRTNYTSSRTIRLYDLLHRTKKGNRVEGRGWMSGNYLMVRYEDVYEEPMKAMREMYNFVGLNPSWATDTWTSANTKSKYSDSLPFSTERDVHHQIDKWKKNLFPREVMDVTYNCARVLYNYGYFRSKS